MILDDLMAPWLAGMDGRASISGLVREISVGRIESEEMDCACS